MSRKSYMRTELLHLPLALQLFGIVALSMMAPAIYGVVIRDLQGARSFFYAGLLGLLIFTMMAAVLNGRRNRQTALGPLLSLFGAFVLLPVFCAVPFLETLPTTRPLNAYFEMVSAMTTTGATLFQDPERLSGTLHLWRAQVGWMGGLLMWVAASAILAPLHLGGFEVTAQAEPGRRDAAGSARSAPIDPHLRVLRATKALAPIYAGLTLLLWLLLLGGGKDR